MVSDSGVLLNSLRRRALSRATASDDIVRGTTERPQGAMESVGEGCGTVLCGPALVSS